MDSMEDWKMGCALVAVSATFWAYVLFDWAGVSFIAGVAAWAAVMAASALLLLHWKPAGPVRQRKHPDAVLSRSNEPEFYITRL